MGCQPHWHWQAPGNQNAAPGRQEPNNLRHRPTTASACTACISRVDIRQGRQCQRGRARRPVRCSAVRCSADHLVYSRPARTSNSAPSPDRTALARAGHWAWAGRTRFRLPVYYSALHGASARLIRVAGAARGTSGSAATNLFITETGHSDAPVGGASQLGGGC